MNFMVLIKTWFGDDVCFCALIATVDKPRKLELCADGEMHQSKVFKGDGGCLSRRGRAELLAPDMLAQGSKRAYYLSIQAVSRGDFQKNIRSKS